MFNNFSINSILDAVFKEAAIPWTNIYLSLHTADPGTTGASEAAQAGYARIDVTAAFAPAAAGAIENDVLIGPFTTDGGEATVSVTHFGIWDAASAGNFIFGGAFTAAANFGPADQINIPANELDISVTSA